MQSKTCGSCGFQTAASMKQCPKCGIAFAAPANPPAAAALDYHDTDPRSQFFKEYFRKGFAATFGAVSALVVIHLALLLLAFVAYLIILMIGALSPQSSEPPDALVGGRTLGGHAPSVYNRC